MAEIITMPRLSDTMTEGKVAKWHKKVGDIVKEGDILAEIETDKAIQDFENEINGTLLYIGVDEGAVAQVDHLLAIVGAAGTDISSMISDAVTPKNSGDQIPDLEITKEVQIPITAGNTISNERIFISPLAKKIAEGKEIDLSKIQGSGEHGRIVKKDVENYEISLLQNPERTTDSINLIMNGTDSETPNSQMRTIIAKRLSESKFTAPHYYLMIEVNMDSAMEARASINALPETKVSFNDMMIKAVAMTLRLYPEVNSSWGEDKIVHHGKINIGTAVAVTDGLVVPVINNTDYMSLNQISIAMKDLAARAKNRTLKADEMTGSTFSISNLGMFGIESFTSIINQPNVCILSIGAIIEKPIVRNGQIVIGNTMKLSLACDHRVVDGATGARFLQTLKSYIENPVNMLA